MSKFIAAAEKFVRDEEGATMVEYGLMVGLIAVVCILVVTALGTQLGALFNTTQNAVGDATTNQITPS